MLRIAKLDTLRCVHRHIVLLNAQAFLSVVPRNVILSRTGRQSVLHGVLLEHRHIDPRHQENSPACGVTAAEWKTVLDRLNFVYSVHHQLDV